jgi:hypothetical protein
MLDRGENKGGEMVYYDYEIDKIVYKANGYGKRAKRRSDDIPRMGNNVYRL